MTRSLNALVREHDDRARRRSTRRRAVSATSSGQTRALSSGQAVVVLDPRETVEPMRVRPLRIARKASWKLRRQLAPLVAIAGAWGSGAAAHAAEHGVRIVLIASVLAGAATWLFSRRWLDGTRERFYAGLVLAAAAGWLLATALWGAGPPMPAILWASGAVLALPWWWRHRYRPTVGGVVDTSAEDIWAERVAASGKALPGSHLVDVQKVTNGWCGRIRLVAGDKSTNDAIGATSRIASAFEKPLAQVIVEPTADGIASHAQLTVLNRNPLMQVRTWAKPSFDSATGTFDFGIYSDGGTARFAFLEPGSGAKNALLCGAPGAGKTSGVSLILTEAHLSRLIAIWLADPQHGQSLPAWNERTDWTALGVERTLEMLRAGKQVVMGRSRHLARVEWVDDKGRGRIGRDAFELSPEMPELYIVVEEAHEVLQHPTHGPEAVQLIEAIGKMGRKTGVGVCLVTQLPSLAELGGSHTLRSMVSSGNVVVYRTADRVSGNMAFSGALPVDPAQLPRTFADGMPTHGLGYVLGASARHASMRSLLVGDPHEVATGLSPLTLDEVSAVAGGDAYARRRDAEPPSAAPTVGNEESGAGSRASLAERVLSVLTARGETTRGDVIAAVGASPRGVADALNELQATDRVAKVGHGRYRLVSRAERY